MTILCIHGFSYFHWGGAINFIGGGGGCDPNVLCAQTGTRNMLKAMRIKYLWRSKHFVSGVCN